MYGSKFHALSLSAAVALSFGVLQSVSDARSVPGSAGRPANSADFPCFSLFFSSITNNCTGVKRVDVPLVVDTSGTITAQVRAQGATAANNVVCELVAWDASTFASSGSRALPAFGSPQFISLTNGGVFPNDSVFVGCDVSPGGTIHTVIY